LPVAFTVFAEVVSDLVETFSGLVETFSDLEALLLSLSI